MKFLVIGATGRTGRLFTAQALNEGHELTALVRRPDADVDPRIRLVTGSVTDPVAIAEASQDVDAIVSTLGVKSIKEAPTLMTDTIRAIIESTKTSGIRRVVIVSAFGVGDSLAKSSRIASLLFRTMLKKKYADKAASEVLLRATDLDWTLEYPGPSTTARNRPTRRSLSTMSRSYRSSRRPHVPTSRDSCYTPRWRGPTSERSRW